MRKSSCGCASKPWKPAYSLQLLCRTSRSRPLPPSSASSTLSSQQKLASSPSDLPWTSSLAFSYGPRSSPTPGTPPPQRSAAAVPRRRGYWRWACGGSCGGSHKQRRGGRRGRWRRVWTLRSRRWRSCLGLRHGFAGIPCRARPPSLWCLSVWPSVCLHSKLASWPVW